MKNFDPQRYKVAAKRKGLDEWVSGFLLVNDAGAFILDDIAYTIDPETISRTVGINDPGGAIIHENDIVVWRDEYDGEILETSVIIWDEEMASFLMLNQDGLKVDVEDSYFYYGNRFDNENLLSDKQREYFAK